MAGSGGLKNTWKRGFQVEGIQKNLHLAYMALFAKATYGAYNYLNMSFIEWDQSYSVSVALIDNQHKRLFALINDFHDAKTNLDEVIQDLLAYIDFHFKTEEKYFDEFYYEKKEWHKKQHKFYEDKIRELYSQYLSEKVDEGSINVKVEDFIKDWIVNHIKVSDKEYTSCFQQHGLI